MSVVRLKNADGSWTAMETIEGYTPVKGVDYFTTEEIEEIKTEIYNDIVENILGDINAVLDEINGEVV